MIDANAGNQIQTVIREPIHCQRCGSLRVRINGAKNGSATYVKCATCFHTFKVVILDSRPNDVQKF